MHHCRYGYDDVMRQYEDSVQRLGCGRVEVGMVAHAIARVHLFLLYTHFSKIYSDIFRYIQSDGVLSSMGFANVLWTLFSTAEPFFFILYFFREIGCTKNPVYNICQTH